MKHNESKENEVREPQPSQTASASEETDLLLNGATRRRCFVVFGSDARLRFTAATLQSAGLIELPESRVQLADYLLFGMPTDTLEPYTSQLSKAKPGALLFGGKVSRAARMQAAACDIPVIDYLESEELALLNAVPTAEGALGILFAATPGTLWRAVVLVLGYGRISKVLVPRLQALGCRITVVARSEAARAQALTLGTEATDFSQLPQLAQKTDFIINTVPQLVVDETVLAQLPKTAFILDLASAPGGVDFAAAEKLGIRTQLALGLPGKWAPGAAGEAIGQTICHFLQRGGLLN